MTMAAMTMVRAHTQDDARRLRRELELRGHETSSVGRARKTFATSAVRRQIDRLVRRRHLRIGPWTAVDDPPPRPQEVSLHAIRELFETSDDADVVRAAVRAVVSIPPGIRYLTRAADGDPDQGRALATLATAWHAHTRPRTR